MCIAKTYYLCLFTFFQKKSWNNAELRYDGSTFEARVKNVDQYGKMREVKDSKPLTGILKSYMFEYTGLMNFLIFHNSTININNIQNVHNV